MRLEDVLDGCESSHHVTVERGVADRELALVAGRQHKPPVGVREGHEDRPPDASLEVLLGECQTKFAERRTQSVLEGREGTGDRNLDGLDAESVRERVRVGQTSLARVRTRHEYTMDVPGAERVGGESRHERGIDAARQTEDNIREAVLAHVVAKAGEECRVDLTWSLMFYR